MDETLKKRLLDRLNGLDLKKLSDIHVVLLPDFFVDHFLYFEEELACFHFCKTLKIYEHWYKLIRKSTIH